MISLLFLFAIGYALGMFVPGRWRPFLLCLPASPLVYLFTQLIFTAMSAQGIQFTDSGMLFAVSVMQVPLMMLGTYWARRRARRDNFTI